MSGEADLRVVRGDDVLIATLSEISPGDDAALLQRAVSALRDEFADEDDVEIMGDA